MDIEKIDRDLVPESELGELRRILPSLRHDFEVKPVFRTETEARVSVLNQVHFPTPHAKYWQSVREQQVHFEQLVYLSFGYRRKKVELAKIERKLSSEQDDLERELLEIDREQILYEMILASKVAQERIREVKQWHKIKGELAASGGFSTDNPDNGAEQLKTYTKTFILELLNSGLNAAPAEAQNLIGKAVTAKNRCKELGIWREVTTEMGLTREELAVLGE